MKITPGLTALITGAAGGIGSALAAALAKRGVNLILVDHDADALGRLHQQLADAPVTLTCWRLDAADEPSVREQLQALRAEGGHVHLFFACAGVCAYRHARYMDYEDWRRAVDVNLLSPIIFVHHLLPSMAAQPPGHIVLLSSMYGFYPDRKLVAYSATKHGVVGLGESLWAEVAMDLIGVTVVCPGFVRTDFAGAATQEGGVEQQRLPPRWLCISAERLARKVLRAVERDRTMVVVTPLARLLWYAQRFTPWLLRMLKRLRFVRAKRNRALAAQRAAASES